MKIAREGWPFILATAVAAAIAVAFGWNLAAIAAGGFCAFFLWFFRDPDRESPVMTGGAVAPADGRVVSIVDVDRAPLLEGAWTRVSIFMSPIDVHINRMPAAGTIEELSHRSGRFLAAYKDEAVEQNEQTALRIGVAGGGHMAVVQVAGFLARRVVCKVRKGDTLKVGERYGLIMFGSRTDLYLPRSYNIEVKEGQKVTGGVTVVGRRVP